MKDLGNRTIIILTVCITTLLFLCIATYLTLTMKDPGPGNCSNIHKTDTMWNADCSAIIEKEFDGSMTQPSKPLYLNGFRFVKPRGQALGVHTWYRYRYVDVKTGKYSKFSPWTKSSIIAGGKNLPCKDGDCSNVDAGKNNKNYCKSNLVEVGIDNLDYDITSGVYANVHRYASKSADPPDSDTDKDKIVGYLYPNKSKSFHYIDAGESVCKELQCSRHVCK